MAPMLPEGRAPAAAAAPAPQQCSCRGWRSHAAARLIHGYNQGEAPDRQIHSGWPKCLRTGCTVVLRSVEEYLVLCTCRHKVCCEGP